MLFSLHGLGLLFFAGCWIDKLFFINDGGTIENIKYTTLFTLYSVFLFSALIFMLIRMFICIKRFIGIERVQAKFIFLGIVIFGLFSFFVSFLLPMFGLADYIMLDTTGSLFFVGLTAYAIVKYHLLGIDVVIKKSTLYTLMLIFVIGIYIATIFLFEYYFQQFLGYYSLLSRIVAGFIIAITFLPIRNKLEKIIDKIFLRNKYEYFKSLRELSQNLITILDLRELMGTIVKNISQIMQVKKICLLFQSDAVKGYQVKAYVGFDNHIRKVKLFNRNRLVSFLKNEKRIAVLNKFKERLPQTTPLNIVKQMERLEANLIVPLFFNNELIGLLSLGAKESGDIYSIEDLELLQNISNQAAIAFSNAISYDNLKKTYMGTIEAFIKSIEAKDKYTWGHSERVVNFAVRIAIQMNIPRKEVELLKYAGFLHDIGKIVIDRYILNKPSNLSKVEFNEIKKHPVVGKEIISQVRFLKDVSHIILYHHERWDGKGYPHGLARKEIPLLSRILCIADAFDAMTSKRPYKPRLSYKDAVFEIERNSGTQFDPVIVQYFIESFSSAQSA